MKKLLCVLLVFLMLSGCTPMQKSETVNKGDNYITGVWLSYAEIDNMLNADFKTEFESAVKNCNARNITDMFVHIRPYCDAIYRSQLFPIREGAKKYDFDVLSYMIEQCHNSGIRLHAWINPYRVRTADSEWGNLPIDNPAYKWLNDQNAENDKNVLFDNGIYLNPASTEVRQLVINGVREIVDNYNVDGIHFDDYFYPTTNEAFDSVSYFDYVSIVENPMPLDAWRRANVNALISGVYTAVKFKNKNIVFSVSPSASLEENYNKHYADIKAWIKSDCVDYIIPQLYFGFNYPDENFKFEKLLSDWQDAIKNTETKLLTGIASYKINTDIEPDRAEWANGVDVIKKQVEICKNNSNISGHIFFSYSSVIKYL